MIFFKRMFNITCSSICSHAWLYPGKCLGTDPANRTCCRTAAIVQHLRVKGRDGRNACSFGITVFLKSPGCFDDFACSGQFWDAYLASYLLAAVFKVWMLDQFYGSLWNVRFTSFMLLFASRIRWSIFGTCWRSRRLAIRVARQSTARATRNLKTATRWHTIRICQLKNSNRLEVKWWDEH